MRKTSSFLALLLMAGCTPPHPTNPSKIACRYEVEAVLQARIDHSRPSPTQEQEDPCLSGGGFVSVETWAEMIPVSSPICVAAGTTSEQAATYCSNQLQRDGVTIGAPTIVTIGGSYPGSGRICPGSDHVVSARYAYIVGPSAPQADACREGTTWPLQP
jgi:hypothetical protein